MEPRPSLPASLPAVASEPAAAASLPAQPSVLFQSAVDARVFLPRRRLLFIIFYRFRAASSRLLGHAVRHVTRRLSYLRQR